MLRRRKWNASSAFYFLYLSWAFLHHRLLETTATFAWSQWRACPRLKPLMKGLSRAQPNNVYVITCLTKRLSFVERASFATLAATSASDKKENKCQIQTEVNMHICQTKSTYTVLSLHTRTLPHAYATLDNECDTVWFRWILIPWYHKILIYA